MREGCRMLAHYAEILEGCRMQEGCMVLAHYAGMQEGSGM